MDFCKIIEFYPINENIRPHKLEYKTLLSSGIDVPALLINQNGESYEMTIASGKRAAIPTGYACKLNPSYELQIRPRSGLALNYGVTVLNTPATIDADYEGHIMVILINHGEHDFVIKDGDRIAQFVISPVVREFDYQNMTSPQRGENGFGSTGLHE